MKIKNLKFCSPYVGMLSMIIAMLLAVASAQAQTFKSKVVGKGQPVILIPGLTSDGAVWDETVEKLKGNFECHVLTLPGFAGQEPMNLDNGFLPVVSSQIVEYIESNKLDKPIVIGHSLGGFLALYISAEHPELIHKNVIVDSLPFLGAIQNPAATEESMKSVANGITSSYKNMTTEEYDAQQRRVLKSMITDKENIETAFEWGKKSDPETVSKAIYELYTTDLRDDVAKIETPTLVLGSWIAYKQYGVTKEMTRASFQNQYQALKGVEIKMSDKGRHFIMWDDPEFYLQEVKGFLAKN